MTGIGSFYIGKYLRAAPTNSKPEQTMSSSTEKTTTVCNELLHAPTNPTSVGSINNDEQKARQRCIQEEEIARIALKNKINPVDFWSPNLATKIYDKFVSFLHCVVTRHDDDDDNNTIYQK